MSVAIATKFLGPTDRRGSRVKAYTLDNNPATGRPDTLTTEWLHNLNPDQNYTYAARKLAAKLEWNGNWRKADTNDGCVFSRDEEVAFSI